MKLLDLKKKIMDAQGIDWWEFSAKAKQAISTTLLKDQGSLRKTGRKDWGIGRRAVNCCLLGMSQPRQSSPNCYCGCWNSSTHDWDHKQSIMNPGGCHMAIPLSEKLLCTDGFWRRGNHCPQLYTHWGIQQARMESSKPIITCMDDAG